jgi:spore maturation protein CgeB
MIRRMRVVMFCHSLVSDWNHGNAHFLRGITAELMAQNCEVVVYEPADGWSRQQLLADQGPAALLAYQKAFPLLQSHAVDLDRLPLDAALDGADVVIVHEWSPHALVARIGRHKARGGRFVLLFHDTHHRSVTDMREMAAYDLDCYDGVLAFGEVIRQRYLALGWARRAWTWHEAADTRTFTPVMDETVSRDLVWIGNWGDGERARELTEYLVNPVQQLGLTATVYGVRYPPAALQALDRAGIQYAGWLPNYETPHAYARHRMTVHVPRRAYIQALPGIPTIRMFEALACGVPLVSMRWDDAEALFTEGADYLVADSPAGMRRHLRALREDRAMATSLAAHGRATILRRHTCAHRVAELMAIIDTVRQEPIEQAVTA